MERMVKVGIIGCGGIADHKHMPALSKLKNVKMVAFCDIIEERAIAAREEYGDADAKVYVDYKELLSDPEIEVVHVLTPNREHADISIDALYAGKHVLVSITCVPLAYVRASPTMDQAPTPPSISPLSTPKFL